MNARRVAILAVSIALVTVVIAYGPKVPVPATGGFGHLGFIVEVFIALAFGPLIGGLAAGIGAALSDLILGFASFAPLTLVAHGVAAFLVGLLGFRRGWGLAIAAWVVGGLAQVGLYFLGEATIYGFGFAVALAEVPINLVQVGVGIFGVLLYQLVKLAYPQIDQLAEPPVYEEVPPP